MLAGHFVHSTVRTGLSAFFYPDSEIFNSIFNRVIFMEDHIPIRPDRSLILSRQASNWSLWDVVSKRFHSERI